MATGLHGNATRAAVFAALCVLAGSLLATALDTGKVALDAQFHGPNELSRANLGSANLWACGLVSDSVDVEDSEDDLERCAGTNAVVFAEPLLGLAISRSDGQACRSRYCELGYTSRGPPSA